MKTNNYVYAVFISFCLSAFMPSKAEESSKSEASFLDNISSEYVACAAYYTVTQAALINAGESDTAIRYGQAIDIAFQYAHEYAMANRPEDMATKVTKARFESYTNGMMEEIDGDASNIAILFRYSDRCKEAMENPEDFAKRIAIETKNYN